MSVVIVATLQRGKGGTSPFPVSLQKDDKRPHVIEVDQAAREAIEEFRRMPYMTCFQIDNQTTYRLGIDVTIGGQVWTAESTPSGFQLKSEKNQPSGYVGLNVDGFVDPQYIRSIYASDFFVVDDEAGRFAQIALTGDIVHQLDNNKVYIKKNNNTPPTVAGDWADITVASTVSSVNGQVGAVVIDIDGLLAFGTNQTEFDAAVASAPAVGQLDSQVATNVADIVDIYNLIAGLGEGIASIGLYDPAAQYAVDNVVIYDPGTGRVNLYRCTVTPAVGIVPTDTDFWEIAGDFFTQDQITALLDDKADLVDGKVPLSQLPSSVTDAVNFGEEEIRTLVSGIASIGLLRNYLIAAETGTTDDMIELTGLTVGDKVQLRADTGDTITVKHNNAGATIKILLQNDIDFILDEDHPLEFVLTTATTLVQVIEILADGSGTTANGNAVNLGGSLTNAETNILRNAAGFSSFRQKIINSDDDSYVDINMSGGVAPFVMIDMERGSTGERGFFFSDGNVVQIRRVSDTAKIQQFEFFDAGMFVADTLNQKGLEELSDYSANYGDRNYISKGYAISQFLSKLSASDISYGESYFINFRDRVLDDAGTYFPNSGGYEFGKAKQLGIDRKMSLMMIPSGVKAGNLYSVKPQDGIGDFDVVRASEATYVDEDGIIRTALANVPRVDYTDGDGVLLLEPAPTNLIEESEAFDNVYWTKLGATIDDNGGVGYSAPDDSLNAFKLVEDGSTGGHRIFRSSVSVSASTDLAYSLFVKKSERKYVAIAGIHNPTNGVLAQFNLDTGTLVFSGDVGSVYTYVDSSIELLANGWYKISLIAQTTGIVIFPAIAFSDNIYTSPALDNAANDHTGDGTSGGYIFGAQLEELSYPTSYIPTSGATASRIEDPAPTISSVNSTAYNFTSEDFSFEFQFKVNLVVADQYLYNKGVSNTNGILILLANDGKIYFRTSQGGASQQTFSNSIFTADTDYKVVITRIGADVSIYVNGVDQTQTQAAHIDPVSASAKILYLGSSDADIIKLYGSIEKFFIYNSALTPAKAIALTTP